MSILKNYRKNQFLLAIKNIQQAHYRIFMKYNMRLSSNRSCFPEQSQRGARGKEAKGTRKDILVILTSNN